MEPEFWLDRWREHNLGWHREDVNPLIIAHWPSLGLAPGSQVFVPLCGKTLDMGYLAGLGHHVLGCELSPIAAREFFESAGASFERREAGRFMRYFGDGVSILQGDLFALDASLLAGTEGVFDRGAIIALPPETRQRYVAHLTAVLPRRARILLLTLEYDQTLISGPPFSVREQEVRDAYGDQYQIDKLIEEETKEIPPRFAEVGCGGLGSPVMQAVYRLIPR